MKDTKPVPYLRKAEFGYENIDGHCGLCGDYLIINRATDLSNASWASGMTVHCPSCGGEITISGETGNHPVDLFWMSESYTLFLRRHYMQSIVALGQAVEMALTLCAATILVHNPLFEKDTQDSLRASFEKQIMTLPLGALRRLLVVLYSYNEVPQSASEARRILKQPRQWIRREVNVEMIQSISADNLREAVRMLWEASIVDRRNAVVHHYYRPAQHEVEMERDEVRRLIRVVFSAFGVTKGQLIMGPPEG